MHATLSGAGSGAGLKLALMAIGAVSLYVGYRLFCDVPRVSENRPRPAVVRNFVAGALLAVLGLGILFHEARGFAAQRREAHGMWNRTKPAQQGSFESPRPHHATVVMRSA